MTLQEIIDESKRIVFFGGAGVSTESGIPDFRSVDGYTIRNTIILPRKFFPIPSLCLTRIIFIIFTETKCSPLTPSRTPLT